MSRIESIRTVHIQPDHSPMQIRSIDELHIGTRIKAIKEGEIFGAESYVVIQKPKEVLNLFYVVDVSWVDKNGEVVKGSLDLECFGVLPFKYVTWSANNWIERLPSYPMGAYLPE